MSAPILDVSGFDAPALLDELRRRGAALERRGALLHLEAPRGSVADLLPDLARFKPALLELLSAPANSKTAPSASPVAQPSPLRRVSPFLFVPCGFEAAPGAARIAARLQSFEPLFTAARRGELPDVGEPETGAAARQLEKAWSDRARECQREQRALTGAELSALESAAAWHGDLAPEVTR